MLQANALSWVNNWNGTEDKCIREWIFNWHMKGKKWLINWNAIFHNKSAKQLLWNDGAGVKFIATPYVPMQLYVGGWWTSSVSPACDMYMLNRTTNTALYYFRDRNRKSCIDCVATRRYSLCCGMDDSRHHRNGWANPLQSKTYKCLPYMLV